MSNTLLDNVVRRYASANGLLKEAGFGADRQWFQMKLGKNPDGKHLTNYGGVGIEAFWLPIPEKAPKGEGAIFIGKQNTATGHYIYKDYADFEKALDLQVESVKYALAQKAKRMQERKDYKHDYVVGDILYSSWGYDQTNVNFYQVIAVVGKQVTLREVASKTVRSDRSAEYVAAMPDRFVGPPIKKMVQQGGMVNIDSSQRAYKWDGKPKYETAWGGGH